MDQNSLQFLQSESDFLAHLQAQLMGLAPGEIGRRFARFSQYLFCYTEPGRQFKLPQCRKETHDGGVDLEAESHEGERRAYIQVKYTIRSVDDIDQIISKLHNFDEMAKRKPKQISLFDVGDCRSSAEFVIITSSKVDNLLSRYIDSERPSLKAYFELRDSGSLHIIDCAAMYEALRNTYKRSTSMPTDVMISFQTPLIRCGEVVLGIAPTAQIQALYNDFGDALFLENIREWLGPHGGKQTSKNNRESPNDAIVKTLNDAPARFLARNNGITIRAKRITLINDKTVLLDEASIVNGCQTTMSIVHFGEEVVANVVVKIVETDDSWDIAQAANFQTNLERMALELARDLRPQLVRAQAQRAGHRFSSESSHRTAFSVIEELYEETVSYEEFRSLFIGLFSRNPSNSFIGNYSELRQDLLAELQKFDSRDSFYEKLFTIHIAIKIAARKQYEKLAGKEAGELFQRFWKDDAIYRSYIALVALAYVAGPEIELPAANFDGIISFIRKVIAEIEKDESALQGAYECAFKAAAIQVLSKHQDKNEQLQAMFSEIRNAKFGNLLSRARLIAS